MAVGQKKTGLLPIDYQSFSYESQTSQTPAAVSITVFCCAILTWINRLLFLFAK